jgi:hypothetical protein
MTSRPAGTEHGKEPLARHGSCRDVELAAERGDGEAALGLRGQTEAKTAAGGRIQPGAPIVGPGQPGCAFGPGCGRRRRAGSRACPTSYERRAARRIIRRSGVIAMRNLSSAAGRVMRVRAFVASGIAGGLVPLADGRGRVWVVLALGAVGSGMTFPFRGAGLGVTRLHRRPLGERPAGRVGAGGFRCVLADAQQGRRQLPAGVAWCCRDRPGTVVAGGGGCRSAEPPAPWSVLPSGVVIGGSSGSPASCAAAITMRVGAAALGSWQAEARGAVIIEPGQCQPVRGLHLRSLGAGIGHDQADAHELLRYSR